MTGATEGTTGRTSSRTPRRAAAAASALALLALVAGLLTSPAALAAGAAAPAAGFRAALEVYDVPGSGTFQLTGLGYGHGIGMSQFGAEGMGRLGKSHREILTFYFPGTRFADVPGSRQIRVGLSGLTRDTAQGAAVVVRPRQGLHATSEGAAIALPDTVAGEAVSGYRLVRRDRGLTVWAASAAGVDKLAGGLGTVRWESAGSSGGSRISVQSAAGGNRTYRGVLDVKAGASSPLAVNRLRLEAYLRSVVSAEVPASWTAAALQAQAVAARSYALLAQVNARAAHRPYDICDTTYCQVYGAVSTESAPEVAAVRATAGSYLVSAGQPVFAMFSSANGGYSVSGSRPYLVAQPDPYDGVVTGSANWGHRWDAAVSASTIERAWPQIGSLQRLKVLGRDGNGSWGGRVLSVGLVGSQGTVSVSADSFRWAAGLKSTWWTVTNADGESAAPAKNVRVARGDRAATVRWGSPDTTRTVRRYRVTVTGVEHTYRVDADRHRLRVTGLTNGRQYRARVTPVYRSGPGPRTSTPAFVPSSLLSYYRPLAATRLVDRDESAAVSRSETVRVQVTGAGTAPSSGTRAVAVRVMATSAGRQGRVLVSPCGAQDRSQVAVVYPAGEAMVGLATVPARADTICLRASTRLTALRVDLLGYYTASGVGSTALRVVAVRRVVNSVTGRGWSTGRLVSGEPRTVPVAGRQGIPAAVRTVLVSVGLIDPTEPAMLSTAPAGTPPSLGAAVRAPTGQWRTATVVAHLDADGRLPLRLTSGRADVQVDVLGWFHPQRGGAAGRFRSMTAVQVLDPASSGSLDAGQSRQVLVRGGATGVPQSAGAVVVQALARGDGDAGHLTVLPAGSSAAPKPLLAYAARGTQRTLVVVPVGDDGRITVAAEDAAVEVSFRVIGWYS